MRILVSGMLAADPHQGGATWAVLQYALGLERLGHDVAVVDPRTAGAESEAYLAELKQGFGLDPPHGDYDVLLNVSGMLRDEALESIPIRVYLDLDPVFNQLWHLQGIDAGLEGHTHHVTLGVRRKVHQRLVGGRVETHGTKLEAVGAAVGACGGSMEVIGRPVSAVQAESRSDGA